MKNQGDSFHASFLQKKKRNEQKRKERKRHAKKEKERNTPVEMFWADMLVPWLK
jgi:hypothetical protein